MSKIYKYFVEGEFEEKLINILKTPPINCLTPGKVEVFNVIQDELSKQRLLSIKPNSIVVLVYDIDVNDDKILKINVEKLKQYGYKNIIHIQSIRNFEDELVYCSSVTSVNQIFKTQSKSEFKSKFMHSNNILNTLKNINFDISKLWSRNNIESPFNIYCSNKINDIKKN